jgi:hypothetical protein
MGSGGQTRGEEDGRAPLRLPLRLPRALPAPAPRPPWPEVVAAPGLGGEDGRAPRAEPSAAAAPFFFLFLDILVSY